MYSRPGCHLCEVAAEVITRVCADLGEEWVEISIDDDPALREEYGEEIPVTLVDGRRHDFWRVDEARLRAALARPTCSVRACHAVVACALPRAAALGKSTRHRVTGATQARRTGEVCLNGARSVLFSRSQAPTVAGLSET